jgi:SAM-dependent methyltransferase
LLPSDLASLSSVQAEIEEQRLSNESSLPYFGLFGEHRARLTSLVRAAAAPDSGTRLCVLGAGNSYDLDLGSLAEVYREIHLVDLDGAALRRARERQDPAVRERIFGHAAVDLSGLLDRLERWQRLAIQSPDEVTARPEVASAEIAEKLPGPFDVVVSACVLTQMQLAPLNVLSPSHPLFAAVRQNLDLTHLQTMARLLAPGGRAILTTDLVSNLMYPLENVEPGRDLRELMRELIAAGNVIYAALPDLLQWLCREDPLLARTVKASPPHDAWLWRNGPERIFLVYALEMRRP